MIPLQQEMEDVWLPEGLGKTGTSKGIGCSERAGLREGFKKSR